MKSKKSRIKRKRQKTTSHSSSSNEELSLYSEVNQIKKHLELLRQAYEKLHERTEDVEIHINLLTRLLTTICVEKLGMRIGVLKRLLKRIENEAIRDSQILHLESLYNLPASSDKKSSISHPPKKDPWEDIS